MASPAVSPRPARGYNRNAGVLQPYQSTSDMNTSQMQARNGGRITYANGVPTYLDANGMPMSESAWYESNGGGSPLSALGDQYKFRPVTGSTTPGAQPPQGRSAGPGTATGQSSSSGGGGTAGRGEQPTPQAPQQSYPGYTRYTGNNSDQMISNDRDFAFSRGDELYQQSKDRAVNEGNVKAQKDAYGDEVYDPLIGGQGGYSAEDAEKIGADDFGGFTATGDDLSGNFMTPDETSLAYGNPWDRAAYFNPEADMAQEDASAGRQRGAVDSLERGLMDAYGGELGLSDEYGQNLEGSLSGTEGAVRGSYDPNALRADEGSLNRIRMTPQEEQDIVTGAGITAGTGYRAATGDADRAVRAAGIDPYGAASIRSRNERRAASAGSDAITQARIAASGARANREIGAETLRMGGERTGADIGSRNELELGARRTAAVGDKERLRLGTEQDLATRKADAARIAGQTRVGNEENINAQQRQQRQYNTSAGTDIATGIERDSADRAARIAANRQTVNAGNIATKFDQGMTGSNTRAARAKTVADARRTDAQEGRQYLTGRQGQANQNQQNEYNRQAGIYATQGQLGQGTTAAQQKKDQQPKWWEKLIGAGAQAAGAYAGAD